MAQQIYKIYCETKIKNILYLTPHILQKLTVLNNNTLNCYEATYR